MVNNDIYYICPKCKSDKAIHNEEYTPFSANDFWECLVCGYTWET